MIEEKDVMKLVEIHIHNEDAFYLAYISLETIKKIKKGEYQYPFLEITNGNETHFIKLDKISSMDIENDYSFKERLYLEEMLEFIEENEPYGYYILVDEEYED